MDYKGLKWFKCDLHLHTPKSLCFLDKSITPKQYLDKVIEKELKVIAITDHNTSGWINQLKEEAKDRGVTIFPGVELTVDNSQIHLLVLFDIDKTDVDIEDFLISIGITRAQFGQQNTFVSRTVQEVIKECLNKNLLVIPSHIDNFSGLSNLSNTAYKEIIKSNLLTGVQIVHQNSNKDSNITPDLYSDINYSKKSDVANLLTEVNQNNICKLTFSDNPDIGDKAKHGLNGIGEMYTWIKMKDNPDLESLKQALNMGKERVRNIYSSPDSPYRCPKFWIESLSFKETKINKNEINVAFSPQMTSIIGGRGTGKSSIISFVRGILRIESSIEKISAKMDTFFSNKKGGILKEETEISLICNLEGEKYKIDLKGALNKSLTFYKKNKKNKTFEIITEGEIVLDRIRNEIEIYSQKEIYEIAENTHSLLEIIDSDVKNIKEKKEEIEKLENVFKKIYLEMSELKKLDIDKAKILNEISLDKNIVSGLEKSNYKNLLEKEIENEEIYNQLILIEDQFEDKLDALNKLKSKISIKTTNNLEIDKIVGEINNQLVISKLESIINQTEREQQIFYEKIFESNWYKEKEKNSKQIKIIKLKMSIDEIDVDSIFKRLKNNNENLIQLEKKLDIKNENQIQMDSSIKEIERLRKEIVELRKDYLLRTLKYSKISMKIKEFRDKTSFEAKLRKILKRESEFLEDINTLSNFLFTGKFLDKKVDLLKLIEEIKDNKEIKDIVLSTRFKTLISNLTEDDMASLYLLYPEDNLEITFERNIIRDLSAGQKTSIILNYLLARGEKTLILDQPEDDLDNKLIYSLVVQEAIKNKEKRQIVMVTHNANIPVNGDSEWTIVMEASGNEIKVKDEKTIDHKEIINNICDIMEGGIAAFKLRESKYKIGIKE